MAPEAVSWFKKGEGLIGTSQAYSEQQAHFFEKALAIEPEFVAALFNLALIYLRQEKLTGALAVLDRLIRIEPDNGPAYSLRVEVYMRRNDLSSAAADTDRLKRLAPDTFLTWQNSGRLNYRLGQMAAAIADFQKALELNPEPPGLSLDLALAFDQAGDPESAGPHFKRFLNYFPEDPKINFLFGQNLILREQFEEGLTYLEKARALGVADPVLNENLAYGLLRLNRFDEAEVLFLQAGDSAATLFNLGAIAEQDESVVIAELYFRRAALKDPHNPEIWTSLGDLFSGANRSLEACRVYQKAVELGSNDFDTLLGLGIAQANSGPPQTARITLEKALKAEPDSAQASFFLGIVHERLREEPLALQYHEKALANGLDTARLHFQLGLLYAKSSRVDESIHHFARALDLDRDKYLPLIEKELLNVTSDLDPVRYQPRFNELLSKNTSPR